MSDDEFQTIRERPVGYQALVTRFNLEVMPHWHRSRVAMGGTHRIVVNEGITEETYPPSYWPGDSLCDHLTFALKYDGVALAILAGIFTVADADEIAAFIRLTPTGKYSRRIWFLFEFLTGKQLPIQDVSSGGYVDLLDPDDYVVSLQPRQIRRQRINDNLLGVTGFCPVVRRTERMAQILEADLTGRCASLAASYSPDLLKRALGYLYTKETKSSFEIEHQKPNATRTERFIAQLQLAETENFCEKTRLIALQNRIVDPRFQDHDYRTTQNYVGETVVMQQERVHYICPKPSDLPKLMQGLVDTHTRMESEQVHPVVHAGVIAYGFVFLHPFEDGNGRIHRFLMHNILARRGYTPKGIMFPVSAAILNHSERYDASLEAFSKAVMPLIDFDLNEQGEMTVHGETAVWYAYPDLTFQVEALFGFIEQTIEYELVQELAFLAHYDAAKRGIQDIVDLPDRGIDLFIRCCLQNQGRLSERKRHDHFAALSAQEITAMEIAVQTAYGSNAAEVRL